MSAKFMHTFTDEHPELQKQIGCMTGIFQMFDRHHLLTQRRLNAHSHKRLPSGHAHLNSSGGAERNACTPKIVMEKNSSKSTYENTRVSMESSRTSFSSSSCSSFSSLECNKSTQKDPPNLNRTIFPERSIKNLPKLKTSDNGPVNCEPHSNPPNSTVHSVRKSLDFREVVKDSIYRDTPSLSVKTSTKEEVRVHVLKHRDSPRPTQVSKSRDGSYTIGTNGKSRVPADVNDSLQVLVKIKEAPWYISETGEPRRSSYEAKDAPFNTVSREAPRFSYDGRRASLDSREQSKHPSKLRELPRLSLDSREGSLRSSNFDSKPNSSLKDSDSRSTNQISALSNLQQEFSSHKHSPSVVAKLMGLEAMPNLSLVAQERMDSARTYAKKDHDPHNPEGNNSSISKSVRATEDSKHDRLARSPRNTLKDPITPRVNKSDSVMKPVSNSRAATDTAPWRQPDKVSVSQKATFGYREAHFKQKSESVYSEIEKRLKELEFRQSNKDLRALKQILDAMQAKGLLETKKGEKQQSGVSVCKNLSNQSLTGDDQNLRSAKFGNQMITDASPNILKGSNTPKAFNSPIVIMKPVKSVSRSGVSASSVIPLEGLSGLGRLRISDPIDQRKAMGNSRVSKDQTPRASSRDLSNQPLLSTDKNSINRSEESNSQKNRPRTTQCSSRPQQSPRESNGSSMKTQNSLSPRLQQRKLEMERKLRPPLHPSESNKPQRLPSSKQQSESVSPRGRLRRKPTKAQDCEDQLSETSETRNLSQQGDDVSLKSDSNISLASQADVEVTSANRSADANFHQSSPIQAAKKYSLVSKKKKSSLVLDEVVSSTKPSASITEQPSPISVLDSSFYQEDLSHSPLKKTSGAFKDDETRASNDRWNLMGTPNVIQPKFSSEINHKKLESIQNLVKKLSELSSGDDRASTTDHIASLCETRNPDHRYVSEILLASGLLLKDLSDGPMGPMPIQLHPSGHPINPDLFLVIEQTKSCWLSKPKFIQEITFRPKADPEKLHRKLLFDVVNEILIQKLELTGQGTSINLLLGARKLPRRFPRGHHLLRELCSEIEQLKVELPSGDNNADEDNSIAGEEVLRRLEDWTDLSKEVPGIVLEIERMIFKDLIDELVVGEAASGLQHKSSRRRKLFPE